MFSIAQEEIVYLEYEGLKIFSELTALIRSKNRSTLLDWKGYQLTPTCETLQWLPLGCVKMCKRLSRQ